MVKVHWVANIFPVPANLQESANGLCPIATILTAGFNTYQGFIFQSYYSFSLASLFYSYSAYFGLLIVVFN